MESKSGKMPSQGPMSAKQQDMIRDPGKIRQISGEVERMKVPDKELKTGHAPSVVQD